MDGEILNASSDWVRVACFILVQELHDSGFDRPIVAQSPCEIDHGTMRCDVLIIGAGAAGIRAALEVSRHDLKILFVEPDRQSHRSATFSNISMGWGIQALLGGDRNEAQETCFFEDIIRAGLGCCDPHLAQVLVAESGARLSDLISRGVEFKKLSDGSYLKARGCFSDTPRAYLTADYNNLKHAFLSIRRQSGAENVTGIVVELMVSDGCCQGAWVLTEDQVLLPIAARATVLATGGGGGIFQDHLVHDAAVGDGYALAYQAGARLNNMEFIQFMLGVRQNGTRGFFPLQRLQQERAVIDGHGDDLLSDAIGDPALKQQAVADRLRHAPFSTRDRSWLVDVAIARAAATGDLFCKVDDSGQPIYRLGHFAHAFNGGIVIDADGKSTLKGLFAAGEVACGPHGADRIGGCMMTATQVFGSRAGAGAAKLVLKSKTQKGDPPRIALSIETHTGRAGRRAPDQVLTEIENGIRRAMQRHAAVLRTARGLKACLGLLESSQRTLDDLLPVAESDLLRWVKLRNMILTAKLVSESALARDQSLGPHLRVDGHD